VISPSIFHYSYLDWGGVGCTRGGVVGRGTALNQERRGFHCRWGHCLNVSGRTQTQPVTEMSTRNISWE